MRNFVLLVLGLTALAGRVEAQGLGLGVTSSASIISVSNQLTYYITVTNETGLTQFINVSNAFSGSFQYVGATAPLLSGIITNASSVTFSVPVTNNAAVQLTLTIAPTSAGSFRNVVLAYDQSGTYNTLAIVITQVNSPIPTADLAVAAAGPTGQVYSNDWVIYSVSVTNLGPGTASSVFLTNTLPVNVGYKGVSPSNKTFSVSQQRSNIVFNLGTLTNQAYRNFQLTVQPTNAGTWTFQSTVSTNSVQDPNPTNNSASFNLTVLNFLSNTNQLTASIVSTQRFNPLSGRLEQNIVVSNAGPTAVASARVTVTGLTNQLSNAMGTNNGHPFVVYAAPLDTNQSGYLLLQYYPTQRPFPFANSQLRADGVGLPGLAPPATGLIATNILLMSRLPSGGIFLEFPSLTNRAFTVEYSSDLIHWLAAQPPAVTPANYTSWIDYGPPATVSHPTNTPMRFYRVFIGP